MEISETAMDVTGTEQRESVRSGIRIPAETYVAKRPIEAEVTYVASLRIQGRNLELASYEGRTVNTHEIHEVIFVDQADIGPGSTVRDAAYLGFIEILAGNKIQTGDDLYIDDDYAGTVAGFDLTHYPNHINIVVRVVEMKSAAEMGVRVGARARFTGIRG